MNPSPKRHQAKQLLLHYARLALGDLTQNMAAELSDLVDLTIDAAIEELRSAPIVFETKPVNKLKPAPILPRIIFMKEEPPEPRSFDWEGSPDELAEELLGDFNDCDRETHYLAYENEPRHYSIWRRGGR